MFWLIVVGMGMGGMMARLEQRRGGGGATINLEGDGLWRARERVANRVNGKWDYLGGERQWCNAAGRGWQV